MATDTQLTNLVVNTLTREQYHEADLTGHDDELFVQSDHAGVSVGANGVDALDTTNTTNCLTRVPQDIKLELNAGVLTLKAGSKVYIPNGFESDNVTPKFDEVTIPNDIQAVVPNTTRNGAFLTYNVDGRVYSGQTYHWSQWNVSGLFSGNTAPTAAGNKIWYDTANNVIKEMNDGANWTILHTSFPFCRFSCTSSAVTSIDQVFNGFGYIGSTVFALPGVNGLVPNGRNSDGTLKNTMASITQVCTWFNNGYTFTRFQIGISNNSLSVGEYTYNQQTNTNSITKCIVGDINGTSGKIDKIIIKQAFRALDYNDKTTIANWAMPSGNSIQYSDVSVVSAGYYEGSKTAVGNGYFWIHAELQNAGGTIMLRNNTQGMFVKSEAPANNHGVACVLPVRKGDSVTYGLNTSTNWTIRFYYAQGDI